MATATVTATRHMGSRKSSGRNRTHPTKQPSYSPENTSTDDPSATLRSLYSPAALAFVNRDLSLTQTLVDAAFACLDAHPPLLSKRKPDPLGEPRRKWDLLRITLETTAHSSNIATTSSSNASNSKGTAGDTQLRIVNTVEPSSLIASLHSRSLATFTPKDSPTPNASEYLPTPSLRGLVFAAIKLDCAEPARNMVEDWLARRSRVIESTSKDGNVQSSPLIDTSVEGYAEVIDVYCLQILPRLGEWEYAMEFLKYEPELPLEKRKHIYTSLKTLHTQVMNPPSPSVRVSRTASTPTTNGTYVSQFQDGPDDRTISPASSGSSSTTATPRPGVYFSSATGIPSRVSSALSTSSLSSVESQQTIRASKQPAPSVLAAPPTSPSSKSASPMDQSKMLLRSPRTRNGNLQLPSVSDGKASPSTSAFPRPPLAPRNTSPSPSSTVLGTSSRPPTSSTPSRGVTLLDALQYHYASYVERYFNPSSSRIIPPILLILGLALPLIAFIARLKGWGRHVAAGAGVVEMSRRRIGGPLSAAPRRAGTNVGSARWLFEAIRDSVVMAGKGLV